VTVLAKKWYDFSITMPLLQHQGERLTELAAAGIVSDYRRGHLDSTLTAFNDVQGRAERIKNTAFLRTSSWFQRMFVRTHGFIVPFAYVNLRGGGGDRVLRTNGQEPFSRLAPGKPGPRKGSWPELFPRSRADPRTAQRMTRPRASRPACRP